MANGYLFSKAPYNLMKHLMSDLSAGDTTVKCCLLTSAVAPVQETWDSYADVVTAANEVVGAGYTAGGAAVTAKTLAEAAKVSTFDGDNVSWANALITARYAVLYSDTPAANADKKLLAFWDFGADYGVINGTLTITWNAAGICTITVA